MCVRRLGLSIFCVVLLGAMAFASAPTFAKEAHVYSTSFGSEGSGPGQFKEPSGIAVNDANGDVYVVDKGNDRVEEFNSTGMFITEFNGGGVLVSPEAIAIDNSGSALDPSNEDVYVTDTSNNVIDKFTSSGTYLGQISTGEGDAPFGPLLGVGVNSAGELWVSQERNERLGEIDALSDEEPNTLLSSRNWEVAYLNPGFAVDSKNNLYVFHGYHTGYEEYFHYVSKLNEAGEVLRPPGEELGGASTNTGVAIDLSDDTVYLDEGASVAKFTASGSSVEAFGSGHLSGGGGLAINSSTDSSSGGNVYVTDSTGDDVAVFTTILVPDVETNEATGLLNEGSAILHGTVNPDGVPITSCKFEYIAESAYHAAIEAKAPDPYEGGATEPCSSNPGTGTSPVGVSANLVGLTPDTIYHYRVVAANHSGEQDGQDREFTAAARPTVSGASVSDLGSTEATVSAQINPGGSATTYYLEYGSSTAYGLATSVRSLGVGFEATSVQIRLSGLQSGTTYYARIVAENEFGTTQGADVALTTSLAPSGSSAALPDNRAYELVSPANGLDVYEPIFFGATHSVVGGLDSARPFRAAADGGSVAYIGEPPIAGGTGSEGPGNGDQYLAVRTPQGWTSSDVMPPNASLGSRYTAFSSDLSVGVLEGYEAPGSALCDKFSSRTSDGVLHPFFTEQPAISCVRIQTAFAGGSADYSHLLYESRAALVSGAERAGLEQFNLYESVGGRLQLVNVLPGTNPEPDPNATFGGPSHPESSIYANFSNAISADGSRVFWTDMNTGLLFLRESGATTVPISVGTASYQTATPNGKYVFYIEGEESKATLLRFNVDRFDESKQPEAQALTEARETLEGEGSGVKGVVGVNETGEDGAYVYFVASDALAAGATSQTCSLPKGSSIEEVEYEEEREGRRPWTRGCNLYMSHGGATTFITMLSPGDDALDGDNDPFGDWQPGLGARTTEVSADGRSVGFMSRLSLTGYENHGVSELYVYDSTDGRLSCASCSPSESPAAPSGEGAWVPREDQEDVSYTVRWLSEDGSRAFFETQQALVPQDSNGRWDVYEWEREGTGSCDRSSGCIYLLSGGGSTDDSFLVDASADGSDVFFTSREDFVRQADGEAVKLYDARVDGGIPDIAPVCTGTGCQGVPSAPPIFATPSSVTFNGVGDFETSSSIKSVIKKKTAAQVKARELAKALGSCKKKSKRKRAVCEKRVRRTYGPATKKGKR